MTNQVVSLKIGKSNWVRGFLYRILYPKSTKLVARSKLYDKNFCNLSDLYQIGENYSFNYPLLRNEAKEKLSNIYFPTIKLIREEGFTNAFQMVDIELTARGYSLFRGMHNLNQIIIFNFIADTFYFVTIFKIIEAIKENESSTLGAALLCLVLGKFSHEMGGLFENKIINHHFFNEKVYFEFPF